MNNKSTKFFKSALTEENPFIATEQVIEWLMERNESVKVNVRKTAFKDLTDWFFDDETKTFRHISGKFFSIDGIEVNTNWGSVPVWHQPIINQPEIGLLGIITKEINGILYFLMQAKIEPGNINCVQLSPTIQATKSNYTQVHKGDKPIYLDYFLNLNPSLVLLDQLQSEQGGRFMRKRNRNVIIQVFDEIEVYKDFCWLTLAQIIKLISRNNTVNMDTRTVISGIPFGNYMSNITDFYSNFFELYQYHSRYNIEFLKSALNSEHSLHSIDDVITWFTHLKAKYDLEIKPIPLTELKDWEITDSDIHHVQNKYFKIIGVDVEIASREVRKWTQPMMEPAQEGLCAFVIKKIDDLYHFIVQAKIECGTFDILEMAPTVQCLTGNYRETAAGGLPFLDYVLNAKPEQIIHDTLQSEEGGRFYEEQNRNIIILADDDFDLSLPDNYIWMTLNQMKLFLKFNNYLNIQARSLISTIGFIR